MIHTDGYVNAKGGVKSKQKWGDKNMSFCSVSRESKSCHAFYPCRIIKRAASDKDSN